MKRLSLFSIVSLFILFFVMLISISLIGSGTVVTSYEGFALDSNENLYLGEYGKINVYKEGSLLYSVDAHTSRAYAFTIQNDEILISTAETVYITDLSGNVINSYKDTDTSLFNELKSNKDSFSLNGSTYKMQKNFGRSRIVDAKGLIVAGMSDKEGYFVGEIDKEYTQKCRKENPEMENRRMDLYKTWYNE